MTRKDLADRLKAWDMQIISWMQLRGFLFTRIAMGLVFIWFGALKPFHLSPAEQLVAETTFWIPIPHFIIWLGIWEVVIGICFLFERTLRIGILLLFLHMPGTVLPFFLLPEQCFTKFPFALTLEGQYIIKNLVLIAAGIVIGGAIRHRIHGFQRFSPSEFAKLLRKGHWRVADPGEVLIQEDAAMERVIYIHQGDVKITREGKELAVSGPNTFLGEISFLTKEPSTATVTATSAVRYIEWPHGVLEKLMKDHPSFGLALHASMATGLAAKLRKHNEAS